MTSEADDVRMRTRLAWARTLLGFAAVTLLVLRGLVVAGRPPILLALAIVPLALAALAAKWSRRDLLIVAFAGIAALAAASALAG